MKRKNIFQTIYITIISAMISCLSYAANSSLLFTKLQQHGIIGESISIPVLQDYCLWIGIVFSSLFLSLNLIISKIKLSKATEERNSLISMSKVLLTSSLGRRFLSSQSDFDIRIFNPKHPWHYKLAGFLHLRYKKVFIIKNVNQIATEGITRNLQFEVSPNSEGLVGLCYNEKAMVYDDDLEHTNETNYSLDQNQVSRTSDLKWSICCPIFNNKNEVVSIIALDGKKRIEIDKEKETALREQLYAYSRMLYDYVPQLFVR